MAKKEIKAMNKKVPAPDEARQKPEPIVIDQYHPARFYSVLWGVNVDTVVRWFQDLPGFLKLSKSRGAGGHA